MESAIPRIPRGSHANGTGACIGGALLGNGHNTVCAHCGDILKDEVHKLGGAIFFNATSHFITVEYT
jgi:hypothetical protein